MKLTLRRDSACALEQRLHATERYLNTHGNDRLAIYLLGMIASASPLPVAPRFTLGRISIRTRERTSLRKGAFDAIMRTLGPI